METRIDKWLWAVRIFKTRSLATAACKNDKVHINQILARASKMVKENDSVTVTLPGIERAYRVLAIIEKRVSAKLAAQAMHEETAPELLERYELIRRDPLSTIFAYRPPGSGRPCKKERRDQNKFTTGTEPQDNEDL